MNPSKTLVALSLAIFIFATGMEAQRPSLTRTAQAVELLESKNTDLQLKVQELEAAMMAVSAEVDTLETSAKPVKIPTTVADAEDLLAWAMSLVMFILVGFVPEEKLPKWLSKFVLSIIVGVIITVIAYFGSNGAFTIGEAVTFLLAIGGGSNYIHRIKKQEIKPRPVPEA